MNRILCIGEALIDMICTDKGKTLSDGEHFLKKAGGAPTNVAAAIAALGGHALLATKVGEDPFGKHLVEIMNGFGVHTEYVFSTPRHFTTFAFVSLMENGERDFYFNRGADGELTWEEVDAIPLNDIQILHFGSATGFLQGPLQYSYRKLLDKGINADRFISFDPNYRHLLFKDATQSFIDQSWEFLTRCDFFKVSDEEAYLLTGEADPFKAGKIFLEKCHAVFCITLGKEGTLLGSEKQLIQIPSIAVQPVDTTGAGDAFVGAVLFQLSSHHSREIRSLNRETWKAIIANANKAGARTCEYMGAMEAFRNLNNAIFQ
jgi:fructokinase